MRTSIDVVLGRSVLDNTVLPEELITLPLTSVIFSLELTLPRRPKEFLYLIDVGDLVMLMLRFDV